MKRFAGYISLLCAVIVPSGALASPARPVRGTVTRTISYVGDFVLTIQTGGWTVGVSTR